MMDKLGTDCKDIEGEAASNRLGWSVLLLANGTIVAIEAPLAEIHCVLVGQVKVYEIDVA